ncbi:MAG: hypothetical protein HYZ20_17345 [Burkholderiales bacterium]|nr:hypothetical protein [Burkholderiales bacterium]
MVAPPGEPPRCAGLRHALLSEFAHGFPLQDSPFQVVARRLGGSVREVLGHCHVLSDSGALDSIRVHWSAELERVRWRCGVECAAGPDDAALRALAAQPGVTHCDWIESIDGAVPPAGMPTLWFDLVARDRDAAEAQLEPLAAALGSPLCLPLQACEVGDDRDGCRCGVAAGPCTDPDLARRCEAGLPLQAHPFRSVSEALHRSEREVLGTLRRWQRAGLLADLGLAPPAQRHETLWTVAAVAAPADGGVAGSALLALPGVAEAVSLPGHPRWPWRLLVGTVGATAQSAALLQRALAACDLGARERKLLRVHRMQLRHAPLLFAGPVDEVRAAA